MRWANWGPREVPFLEETRGQMVRNTAMGGLLAWKVSEVPFNYNMTIQIDGPKPDITAV